MAEWQPVCRVACATGMPAGTPMIRPTRSATASFPGEPDSAERSGDLVLTGLGEDAEAAGAWGAALLLRAPHLAIDARGLPAKTAARLAAGACLRAWRFDCLKTRPEDDAPRLALITLVSDDPATPAAWNALHPGVEANLFARDLVAEPSNTLTPAGFIERLTPLREAGITIEVLQGADLHQFGGLLAVGGGAVHPPCLAILRWPGEDPPVAFVGKGITFDTGGICIKPADHMWEMRADMAGAAACAGAMLALARRRCPTAAIAVLALAENAVGSASYRPGDVLRLWDGSTVAVVDTDAEGRLVLADALAFAAAAKPRAIIDLATLTGSIVTALGHERAGAFTNTDDLADAAQLAGEASGERLWRMPYGPGYRDALDSNIADIRHCVDGRGQPDACHAATFLSTFVGDVPWLHLDIAGVESHEEADERHAAGPTGFGVRLLDRMVTQGLPHLG